MVNLAQAWAEEYAPIQPSVSVEVAGGGSATGITSLIDGTADLANCSRRMEESEWESARRKTGRDPLEVTVGHDALALYVHPANPVTELSLEQLAAIYGRHGSVLHWSQLGVRLPGVAAGSREDEIILISRQSNSGTYQYFRRTILRARGDFRMGTRDLNGSKEVVSLVATAVAAIGYSGMGYDTAEVKMLRVARKTGAPGFPPSAQNTLSGAYPISRPLYVYTMDAASKSVHDYLTWIQSPAGQRVVEASGYVPVAAPRQVAAQIKSEARLEAKP